MIKLRSWVLMLLAILLGGCDEEAIAQKVTQCRFEAQKVYGVQETQYNVDVLKMGFGVNPWRNKIGEMTRLCMLADGFKEVGGCYDASWTMASCYRRKTLREYTGL